MANFGFAHPIVVHFTIALLVLGVILRLISLTGKVRFANHAAALLLILGTLTTLIAVKSGQDAHGPAERIPGVRPLVEEHSQQGQTTRNIFIAVAILEIIALLMDRRKKGGFQFVRAASALVGILGLFFVYEAAEHGGRLVYSYAGGVGTRTGEARDVERLLLAGLYHQGRLDRQSGDSTRAARLFELAGERWPDNTEVQLLYAESLLQDQENAAAALALLQGLTVPENDVLALGRGLIVAEVLKASGKIDEARQELEKLKQSFPQSRSLQRALEQL